MKKEMVKCNKCGREIEWSDDFFKPICNSCRELSLTAKIDEFHYWLRDDESSDAFITKIIC